MKFRLLTGRHIQNETGKDGKVVEKEYKAPAIVEAPTDLSQRFGANKFLRLPDVEKPTAVTK